ncbi:hypothetical protein GTW37_39465 [Streptomyces sp. SID4931]|nr:hypothetical protein [Streptomyces sp. SID4931]SCG10285.1 hypothetical protein GA0115255_127289 [Streptomyces sp. Ncost-T6T-2b]
MTCTPPGRRVALAVLLAVVALGAAGCGSDGQQEPAAAASTTAPPVPQPDPTAHSPGPAPTATARITDPAKAATAYLAASRTVTAADAKVPPRRAEAYMAPDNAERGLGQPVWDHPPAGATLKPTKVEAVETARDDRQAVYELTYVPATVQGAETVNTAPPATVYVVLTRQPDGTWLVFREAPDLSP